MLLDLELKLDPNSGTILFLELRSAVNSKLFNLFPFTEQELILYLDIDI